MTDRVLELKILRDLADGGFHWDGQDNAGRTGFNGIFGSKLVANRKSYIASSFFYPVRSGVIRDLSTGLGYLDYDENLFRLNSGASTNSVGMVETKDIIRYRAGRDAEAMLTIIFNEPLAGVNQKAGIFTTTDGFMVGYNEDTFGVSYKRNDIETFIPQSEFNMDKLDGSGLGGFLINQQNMNIYRINYGYLGIAPVIFSVYGGHDNGWIPFHIIDLTNKQTETHTANPYLPLAAFIENTTNDTNVSLRLGSVYAGVFDGDSDNSPDSTSREQSARIAGTTTLAGETTILTIHSKELFEGKKNYIKSILLYLSATTDGNKAVTLSVKKLATVPVGGTWVDLKENESILESSVDATVDLTGAETLFTKEMSKIDSFDAFVSNLNLSLYPEEYAVFTMNSTNTTEYTLSIRESERF